MKEVEVRLIAELMSNSRRSDRELAQVLGVSQPTVSRMIRRLEKEGYVREYSMIPDLGKLGFEIMSVNFVKFRAGTPSEDLEQLSKRARELESTRGIPYLLVMFGMGMGFDGIMVMFHRNYASYVKLKTAMRGAARGNVEKFESFLIALRERSHYESLSLSSLGKFLVLDYERTRAQHEKE